MAELTIGDKTVTVDDSFLKLSPEEQQKFVEQVHSQLYPQKSDEQIMKEFGDLPWWKQGLTAVGDIGNSLAEGVTFGKLGDISEWLSGDPNTKEMLRESGVRSGIPGAAAELYGAIGSPVTKGVGMAADAIRPAASGLWGALGRLATTAAESGTLGGLEAAGHNQDIKQGAETGAILGAGAHVLAPAVKGLVSLLSNKAPEYFSTAFQAGKAGGSQADSFLAGQRGELPELAKEEYGKFVSNLRDLPVDSKSVTETLLGAIDDSSQGTISRLKNSSANSLNKITDAVAKFENNPTVLTGDALRENLQQYAAVKDKKLARIAVALQNQIKQVIEGVQPGYMEGLNKYELAKRAEEAGQKLSAVLAPSGGLWGAIRAIPGSPRGLGYLAQAAGRASNVVPRAGQMGLMEYLNRGQQ